MSFGDLSEIQFLINVSLDIGHHFVNQLRLPVRCLFCGGHLIVTCAFQTDDQHFQQQLLDSSELRAADCLFRQHVFHQFGRIAHFLRMKMDDTLVIQVNKLFLLQGDVRFFSPQDYTFLHPSHIWPGLALHGGPKDVPDPVFQRQLCGKFFGKLTVGICTVLKETKGMRIIPSQNDHISRYQRDPFLFKKMPAGSAPDQQDFIEIMLVQGKIRLWTAHNDLKETRPLLLVDMENGWNEAIRFDRDIKCEGIMAGDWEMWLRKEIMYGTKIKDDKPLTPVFYLPYRGINTEWDIDKDHEGGDDINKAYTWTPPLQELDEDEFAEVDVNALVEDPYVKVDEEASMAAFNLAREVFDGILDVQFRTWWFWSSHIVLAYSHYRGMLEMMYDFFDNPDKVHEFFAKFTNGYIKKLRQIEADGYLYNNVGNTFVGSGGLGWTDELHPDPANMKLQDMWGLCEAQEAVGVSPDQFHEFIFPYHKQVAELFGKTCYACCEPADPYWEDIKTLHNLRRVSVSQWADWKR